MNIKLFIEELDLHFELHNLKEDIGESLNLIHDNYEVSEALKEELNKWPESVKCSNAYIYRELR